MGNIYYTYCVQVFLFFLFLFFTYKNNAGLHIRTDFSPTQNGHTHSLTCAEAKDNEIHIPIVILSNCISSGSK